jgi:hypothetical protein
MHLKFIHFYWNILMTNCLLVHLTIGFWRWSHFVVKIIIYVLKTKFYYFLLRLILIWNPYQKYIIESEDISIFRNFTIKHMLVCNIITQRQFLQLMLTIIFSFAWQKRIHVSICTWIRLLNFEIIVFLRHQFTVTLNLNCVIKMKNWWFWFLYFSYTTFLDVLIFPKQDVRIHLVKIERLFVDE